MARQSDPYRTLGLDRTASLEEVRRAYRRLAKANHPDAAGEAALPRFLAIQSAYDRLVESARPWQADPARSDATHRAYGGRARRPTRENGKRAGRSSGQGTSADPGASAGPAASAGPSSTDPAGPEAGSRSDWTTRKATLGSTSYDGASHDALEPDWEGASWYGTSSGTYWTTNPREYADPRKHGPEYQARARRDAGVARATTDDAQAPAAAGSPVAAGDLAAADDAAASARATARAPASMWSSGPSSASTSDVPSISRRVARAIIGWFRQA